MALGPAWIFSSFSISRSFALRLLDAQQVECGRGKAWQRWGHCQAPTRWSIAGASPGRRNGEHYTGRSPPGLSTCLAQFESALRHLDYFFFTASSLTQASPAPGGIPPSLRSAKMHRHKIDATSGMPMQWPDVGRKSAFCIDYGTANSPKTNVLKGVMPSCTQRSSGQSIGVARAMFVPTVTARNQVIVWQQVTRK